MKALIALLATTPERGRLLLLCLSGALAAFVGFVLVPTPLAAGLILHLGYYYIFAVFAAFCIYLYRQGSENQETLRDWFSRPGLTGLFLLGVVGLVYWSDPFKHKILFDEYVLQGTAYHMHATKEIGAIVRAYDINGTWVPMDTFLDKRPYFFAFLVSLLHDLTGYRIANMFIVNALLVPVFVGVMLWLAHRLAGRAVAFFAVVLLCSMPLFGQNATSAGMELHNLTMLAVVMALAVVYLEKPSEDRLSLLVLGAILLSQSRYESVIFVVPAAIVIVIGWLREGRVILSWPAVVAPLLLIPYAWHNRVLSASPLLWQLNPGQTSRFSLSYLSNNLQGARSFFFNTGPSIANSWYLSVLGILGIAAGVYWVVRALARRQAGTNRFEPAMIVVILFGVGIAGNLTMLMFYYWSRLDDVIASRFALPMCFLMALAAAVLVARLQSLRIPALRAAVIGLAVWFLGWGLQAFSEKQYTNKNLVMQEIAWEHEFLLTRPGRVLFVSNMSTIPFVLWRIPSVLNAVAGTRALQLKYHLHAGTFSEVLVAQDLKPTTPEGDMGIDPKDVLPSCFKLKTLKIQRFGTRWTRISQLVDVDIPDLPPKAAQAKS